MRLRFVLLGSGERDGVLAAVDELRPDIAKCGDIVEEDFWGLKDLSDITADVAIVFGGDGSVLRAVRQMGNHQIPVIAVNLGTLAFMADLRPAELIPALRRPDFRQLPIGNRPLLAISVFRNGECIAANRLCVNEVCAQRNDFRMLQIELLIDSELVAMYRCDGLILSTPLGSTARNLSAGGPILRKGLDCIVISPISPHTLSNRPVVDSMDRKYELRIQEENTVLLLDGMVETTLQTGDVLMVRKADVSFKQVEFPNQSYYKTLREKLGWSGHFQYITTEHRG